jgi:hypothetical protein
MMKRLTLLFIAVVCTAHMYAQCSTTNLSGNQVISTNTTWSAGTYNISGDFTVNAGVTLTISYSGNCPFIVNANNITILGTINADGAGGLGGGGGTFGNSSGGGGGGSLASGGKAGGAGSGTGGGVAGSDGTNASGGCSIDCGTACFGGNDADRAGGGGGSGGSGGSYGGKGGSGGAGGNGRIENEPSNSRCNSTPVAGVGGASNNSAGTYGTAGNTNDLVTGSGGGGGGGGGGGFGNGTAGASGGNGGGAVNLNASGNLTVSGTISANGTDGGTGGNGGVRSGTLGNWNCENCGNGNGGGANDCRDASRCGVCTYYTWGWPGGAGGGAGGGSGGGIKLQAGAAMTVSGTLKANGGKGGDSGRPWQNLDGSCNNPAGSGGPGGGGVIKYVYNPCANNSFAGATVQANAGAPGTANSGSPGTNTANNGVILDQNANIYIPGYTPFSPLIASNDQTLCGLGNTPATLNSSQVSGGGGSNTYQWYSSSSSSVGQTGANPLPANGWTAVPNGTSATLQSATIGVLNTTTYFQLQVQSGPCAVWSNVVTIRVDSLPVVDSVSVTDVLCNGGNTGAIAIHVSGGTPGYIYSTNNGANYHVDSISSGLAASAFNVYVKDASNCTSANAFPVTINQPAALSLTAATTSANCLSSSNGVITLTAGGGVTPYLFTLDSGANQSSNVFSGLVTGNYIVHLVDNNGCPDSVPATISSADSAVASLDSITQPSCYGATDGAVTVKLLNGTQPYSFSIDGSTFQVSPTFSGLAAGNYSVTAQDASGCGNVVAVQLTQPNSIDIQVQAIVNVPCNNTPAGQIFINPAGGSGSGYAFNWSNGATTQNITGLPVGSYTVSVSDSRLCTASKVVTLTYDQAPTSTVTSTNTGCFGSAEGTAAVVAAGGTLPYAYSWSNGANSDSVSNLAAGTYIVTVTDANFCQSTDTVVIAQQGAIGLVLDVTQPSCHGVSDGVANAGATAGTSPYTYLWSNNATVTPISNLAPGAYAVTVYDANNCASDTTFTITDPAAITPSVTSINDSCYGGQSGTALASATGGTPGYSYLWSNSANTDNINGLPAGSYSVTITDSRNCSVSTSVTITQPAQITIATSSTPETAGQGNGTASVDSISGGMPPYAVQWSTSSSAVTVVGLATGTYTVTVTDRYGCEQTASVFVSELTGINSPASDITFSVYPNPAKTAITVSIEDLKKETVLNIKNILGQSLVSKTLTTMQTQIDLAALTSGVYVVEIKQGDKKAVRELVVTK